MARKVAKPVRREPSRERAPARERDDSERLFGLKAAAAVLALRPRDVLQIAHAPEARHEVAEILRTAAQHRIAYREVSREELARIAGTLHHEGVCLRVKPRRAPSLTQVVDALARGGFGLVLDGVENPHNVGALLRTAAFFGARAMVVRGAGSELTPSAVRVAEGGAEQVPVCFVNELDDALTSLTRAQVAVVVADAHGGDALDGFTWPRRSVLVLGAEREGLSASVTARATHRVHIAGTGSIESLNVSVAAGILMNRAALAARSPHEK
jgi:TrmH RNA methyltransferase